jgi:anti-sigma factor RsiW
VNCDEVALKIESHLDGDLSEDDSRALAKHIAACSHCSVRFAALLQVVEALEGLPEVTAPDELVSDMLYRLPAYHINAADMLSRSATRVRWALSFTGAAASAVIITVLAAVAARVPAWWDSLGAVGRVVARLGVKGVVWAGETTGTLAGTCGTPLAYVLLIDVALLSAGFIVMAMWRRRHTPASVLLTF